MSSYSYIKKYLLNRYYLRMGEAHLALGNICIKCGANSKLELDHINRKTKTYTISSIWNYSYKTFWKEVAKCQLLCKSCHNKKTLKELGRKSAKDFHGTISSYRYCKCSLCKLAKRRVNKEYKKKLKRISNK